MTSNESDNSAWTAAPSRELPRAAMVGLGELLMYNVVLEPLVRKPQ